MNAPDNPPPIPARDAAVAIAQRLNAAGFRALFAGGCVRDKLLGLDPTDYDVATSATPDQVKRVFPKAMGVGEAFGVMLVRHGGRTIEVATFRADGPYDDGRRPNEIRFASDREDALRRDFTVNGLFEDPETGDIIDHVNGRADLDARVLRAIGDASQRFSEDRLRALRAARFAARFSLTIEPATAAAVRQFAHDLAAVSRERIGNEVRRMMAHPTRARAAQLCEELGLASVMLQEPAGAFDPALLQGLPADAAVCTGLAAWMLARTPTEAAANGAGAAGSPVGARVDVWRASLMLSNDEEAALHGTLDIRSRLKSTWSGGDDAARKRIASHPCFAAALQLVRAGHPALATEITHETDRLALTGLAPTPFITGDDVVKAGLAPGPRFKGILDRLYDRQLNGDFVTRPEALTALEAVVREVKEDPIPRPNP